MARGMQGKATIAALGVLAAAVVVALVGVLVWQPQRAPAPVPEPTASPAAPQSTAPAQPAQSTVAPQASVPEQTVPPAPSPPPAAPAPPSHSQATAAAPPPAAARAEAPAAAPPASPTPPAQSAATPPPAAPTQPAKEPVAPSFDVVRVEPSGDSVIAGRGANGATVEMLRDGQVHARGVADQSGLFALVPPPLPPGSHQIALQTIAPDGTRERSKETVTVVISEGRNTRPLVALTHPDKPTVVLSNPEPPEQRAAQTPAPAPAPAVPQPPQQQASLPPQPAPAAAPRPTVKIAAVEAEDGGRLFVSGEAAPGATVRLYLNDTLIAPGGVGGDGKVSFTIGRGVRPGDYRVRLDDVDPVSGTVKSRAEVAFNVPPLIAVPLPPEATPFTGETAVAAAPVAPRAAAPAASAASASAPAAALPSASTPAAPAAGAAPPSAAPPSPPAPSPPPAAAGAPAPPAPAQVVSAPPAPQPAPPASQAPTRAPAPQGQQVAAAEPVPEIQIGTVMVPEVNTALVARGDNLWRISQRVYGRGVRYTVIYGANQPQIRNPHLIYPGQVFVLPGEQELKTR